MFKEMTTKKKIIIATIVIVVIALIIFLVVRRNKKKKKEAELLKEPLVSNYQQTEASPTPRMRVVPKEDQQEIRVEAPLSVQEVIPEKKPVPAGSPGTGAPGTLGVPVNNNGKKPAAGPAAKSSLPPEFMTNANDPNAG